jgi:hypothetical protein
MSDTPETDAKAIHDGEVVPVGFARKLERERDEAKAKLQQWQDIADEIERERNEWRECAVLRKEKRNE